MLRSVLADTASASASVFGSEDGEEALIANPPVEAAWDTAGRDSSLIYTHAAAKEGDAQQFFVDTETASRDSSLILSLSDFNSGDSAASQLSNDTQPSPHLLPSLLPHLSYLVPDIHLISSPSPSLTPLSYRTSGRRRGRAGAGGEQPAGLRHRGLVPARGGRVHSGHCPSGSRP